MEDRKRQGDGRDWAAFGTDIFTTFLLLAPIFMGVLEIALVDSAKAKQRAELDRRAAMKRGGTGDRAAQYAKKEDTTVTAASHKRTHTYDDVDDSELLDPSTGAPPKYDTLEDILLDRELAEIISKSLPEAVARYFVLRINLGQKDAAKAAGIDPRTARTYEQRYKSELRSILDSRS
jgi:hypothetical protein